MPMFSDDGKFNPKAMAVLTRSYVDLKILDSEPDPSKLYTAQFLPKSAFAAPSSGGAASNFLQRDALRP